MNQQQPPQPQTQNPNPKKSSFQITSVTIDSSVSNDGGDDSADELDSHTEDSSDFGTDTSRHPSESRGAGSGSTDDNFTRNDVFFNSAPLSSMGSAPVIPTSSQFGLAIVSSTGTGEVVTSGSTLPVVSSTNSPPSSEIAATETQAISSSVPSTTDKHEAERDHVHNRFKVVKIVSTEPFKKGRWTCMDYHDSTTTTTSTTTATSAPSKDPSSQLHSQQIPQQLPIPHGSPPHQSHAIIQSQGDVLHQQGLQSQAPMTSSPPHQHQPVLTGPSSHLNDPQQANILQAHTMQQQHNVQVMPPAELPQQQQHPVDSTVTMNGLNNGNSYLQMNHNIGVNSHSHTTDMHHVQNAGNMNINHSMVSSTNIPNVAVYQNAPHQQQQQQYYTGAAVVQGNMGPKQGYSTQPQVITSQGAPQHQQAFPHQQLPNHEVVQHSSSNPPLVGQGVQTQVHQQLPGQSLPHGSVIQMTSNVMANNGGSQQQPHTVQSLGHNLMQQTKVPTFLPAAGQQGQVQQQSSNQFTQQQQPTQQIMSQQVNMQPQSSQAQCSNQSQQQAPPQQLMSQQQMNMQQQQSQSQQQAYQQSQQSQQNNMMMSNIPNIHQQHHMQMNSSQVPIQMHVAQGQPGSQNQAMYSQQPQMHQVQMSGQQMSIPNQQQILSQQPQQMMQVQGQTQYSNQPAMVNQQAPQQQNQMLMMNAQQIQGQPQQNIMPSQQMVPSQVMQNSQMNTLVQQPQMVNQSTLQGQVQHMSMHDQPYDMQSIQTQNAYQSQQSQPQTTMGNMQPQGVIHQQQFQQNQPAVVQQTMMAPQMNQVPSGQHVQSQMQQSQPVSQHSQVTIPQPQQQQQPMSLNQDQQTMQMYQNQQQIQTSSATIGSMGNAGNAAPGVQQKLVSAPASNTQMGGQFVASTNLPQMNSGVEIVSQSVATSADHQQHKQVSQPQVMSGDGHSNSQPVMQTQSQPVLSQQPQLSINTNSQPSIPTVHSSGTPVGDTATTHTIHTTVAKTDDSTKTEANDDGDSASGTNTVAIDNKIEQAMDLVKSHLMFAVREEVEVLKEKISELMERITQLEHENTILRTGASQETLALLISSKPPANSNCANANS